MIYEENFQMGRIFISVHRHTVFYPVPQLGVNVLPYPPESCTVLCRQAAYCI